MASQRPQIAFTANHQTAIKFRRGRRKRRTQDASRSAARAYNRQRDLPGLLPVWPDELFDDSTVGRRRLVMKLHRALRAERNRGRAGHWSYDLIRHTNLLHAYSHELRALPDTSWPRALDVLQVGSEQPLKAGRAVRKNTPTTLGTIASPRNRTTMTARPADQEAKRCAASL